MTLESNPVRLGMVGGGKGAFIGGVHRIAARLDGAFRLVAGAFSSDADRTSRTAQALGVDSERAYASFAAMARAEAGREDGIEAVSIVTPNHLHYPVAKAFLEAGIHVICDKPMTRTLAEARRLATLVETSGRLFILTHTYAGYPMIHRAREMVAAGMLGEIRLLRVDYLQDWLVEPIEQSGNPQASWRTDPAKSGLGGAIGDIGTHAYHLARFVGGLETEMLAADLTSFVEGRVLDDNAHVLLRFRGGARGLLSASQVAPGNENALSLRVYGSRGGLEWHQEQPNHLWHAPLGEEKRLIGRGGPGAGEAAGRLTRLPAGHPEGYLEAFANIYRQSAEAIRAFDSAGSSAGAGLPGVGDGLDGMAFVEACVRSSRKNAAWVRL